MNAVSKFVARARPRLSRYTPTRKPAGPGWFAYARLFFITFALFLMTQPMGLYLTGADPIHAEKYHAPTHLLDFVEGGVAGVVLLLMLFKLKALFFLVRSAFPILLYIFLAGLSILFSSDATWSAYALVTQLFSLITILGLFINFSIPRTITSVLLVVSISMIASLAVAVALPRYGVLSGGSPLGFLNDKYSWRGIYYFKNILGHTAAIALVIITIFGWKYIKPRVFMLLSILCAFVCLVCSRSAGGYVIALSLYAIFFLVIRPKGHIRVIGIGALLFGAVTSILLREAVQEYVLGAVGKNENLSGRVAVWDLAEQYVRQKPWFGFGYNYTGSPAVENDIFAHFKVVSVHNAYLDLLINMGILGVSVWALAILAIIRNAWSKDVESDASDLRALSTLLVLGGLLSGLSEAMVVTPLGPGAVLFLCGLFGLAKAGQPSRT
jgi:O-antigen ligase